MSIDNHLIIKQSLISVKEELEKVLPFIKSEIIELNKPSMMGNGGLYFNIETEHSGIAIFFWDSGIFEISTDVIELNNEENVFFNYIPEKLMEEKYPEKSLKVFISKMQEFLTLLKNNYPNINCDIRFY